MKAWLVRQLGCGKKDCLYCNAVATFLLKILGLTLIAIFFIGLIVGGKQ